MHPSDQDLDELEMALSEPDLDDLDENSERYLRAVRSMRHALVVAREQALADEEDFDSSPMDDFEAAYERLIGHLRKDSP